MVNRLKPIKLDSVDSTNDYILRNIDELKNSTVVYTLNQTAGKGRRGRKWQETNGSSLAMSVLHRLPVETLGAVPLVCALAVISGLEKIGVVAGAKWSNDIIVNSKKLCGILCESRINQNIASVVFGIGININQLEEDFINMGIPHGISLKMIGVKADPQDITEIIWLELEKLINTHSQTGFSGSIRDLYKEKSVTLGKNVIIEKNGDSIAGKALDIGSDGSLICSVNGEEIAFISGDVSVRGIMGYI